MSQTTLATRDRVIRSQSLIDMWAFPLSSENNMPCTFFQTADVTTQSAFAHGQICVIEIAPGATSLGAYERYVLTSANIVIYDRVLVPFVTATLPVGIYAEPNGRTGESWAEAGFARVLRLALDGWNVVRLVDMAASLAERKSRLCRIATVLLGAGIAAEIPVLLLTDATAGHQGSQTSLGKLAGVLDDDLVSQRVTTAFAIRSVGPPLLSAIADSGLAG